MRDKVIYSSPNFDPKVFLSWVHKDMSAADLEAGALTLKTDLKGRTQQKKLLVKENFDCFVSCKTTIDDIESKLRQIEEDPEGAGTAHLYSVTLKISGVANRCGIRSSQDLGDEQPRDNPLTVSCQQPHPRPVSSHTLSPTCGCPSTAKHPAPTVALSSVFFLLQQAFVL
ncbi:Exocyst complex component SEC5A, partial [Zea mays]